MRLGNEDGYTKPMLASVVISTLFSSSREEASPKPAEQNVKRYYCRLLTTDFRVNHLRLLGVLLRPFILGR